jgi:hypothetical protein
MTSFASSCKHRIAIASSRNSNRSADWSGDDHSGAARRPLRRLDCAVSGGNQNTGTAGETARHISHRHLRLIVDRNPPPLEALRELQRELDEPRTSEGWWIVFGAISCLAWLAFFFLMGWLS